MFQRKPEIFRKPEKHMKKTFRRKVLKNKSAKCIRMFILRCNSAERGRYEGK